jgi:hypothetical protein
MAKLLLSFKALMNLFCQTANTVARLGAEDPFCCLQPTLRAFCTAAKAFLTCEYESKYT